MIDIHVRISRKLVLWVVGIMVALFVLSWVLATSGGSSSGGVKVGPVQTGLIP